MSNRLSRASATGDAVRHQHRVVPSLPPMNEKAWMRQVVDLARWRGWKIYHTHNSQHSAAGFPDLVLCRPPRLVFAELKTDRKGSEVTADQMLWLEQLRQCNTSLVNGMITDGVFVWRPSDFDDVREVLW